MANPIRRCETCAAYCALPMTAGAGSDPECRLDPPKIRIFPSNQGMQLGCYWPKVKPEQWCTKWLPVANGDTVQ